MSPFILAATVILAFTSLVSQADATDARGAQSFPIETHDNMPLLPVTIRGKEFRFALGTAAIGTGIDSRLKSMLGDSIATVRFRTAKGIQRVPAYALPFKKIGDSPIMGSHIAICTPLSDFRQAADCDFVGIVGGDVFQSQIVEFDFDAGKWRIIDKVPRNAGEAFDYGTRSVPSIPVQLPQVGLQWFQVNTFSNSSLGVTESLFQQLAENGSIPLVRKSPHVVEEGARVVAKFGRIDEITVGKHVHKNVEIISSTRMSVGTQYLSRFRVTIDFPNHIVYLKKGRNYGRADHWDLSGLHYKRIGKKAVITDIEKGSVAEKSGIKPKDVIVRAGDKDGERSHLSDLRKVLAKEGAVEIIIERGEQRLRYTLNLKKMPR